MRVALEATTLTLTSGGLARYTSELARALAAEYPADEIVLLSDQPFPMPRPAPANLKRGGGPRSTAERRWWLWGLQREMDRLHADVFHGPDFAVPYIPRRPSVLTLHDLSPWMDPAWQPGAARIRRRTPVLLQLGIATMVVTVSATVRRQAIDFFHLQPNRVVVTPLAAPAWCRPVSGEPATVPYFLFVGTLEPRKNLAALVEAWRAVRPFAAVDLVLAGRRRADSPAIAAEPGLRLLGEVAEEQLPALYSGALAFVYPSLYEGFGLPVLEAMQCGACVIASRAVEEAAGDAALFASDTADLARTMRAVAEDPELRRDYAARGLARAAEFSWRRTARLTREVYVEAQRRFGD
jgi:glycosyltransferase involved in cell wall biosynthesis